MRRFLLSLYFVLLATISFSQNEIGNTFYVYRNDGLFNAFYSSEVDSITYSCIDKDSVEHEDIVTQEIWTSDSIYRIPLNVIDSISFVKPQTAYKEKVIKLDDRYAPYIISSDSLSVSFTNDLPRHLIPQKNDILLYEGFCDIFPSGFAGRVMSVSDENVVKCDSVEFEDVYEKLILFGDYTLTEDNTNSRKYRLSQNKIAGEIPLGITVPINRSFGPASFQGSFTQGIRIRLVIRLQKGMTPYVELQVKDEELMNIDATINSQLSGFRQVGDKDFRISVPIPECPTLRFEYATSLFIKPEIKSETSFGVGMSSKGQTSYIYDGNCWKTTQIPRTNKQNITAKTGFQGSLWYGVVGCIHIKTIKNYLSIGADTYIGPKLKGNVDLNIADGISTSKLYETLKDTKVDLSLRLESELSFKWRLGKKNSGYTPLFNIIPGIEWNIGEKYLLPTFTRPICDVGYKKVDISSEVSRSLLIPCSVGFRLSNNGNIVKTNYNDKTYWFDDDFSAPLTSTFTNLKYTNGKYTVSPMVKLLGLEFEATPTTDFKYGLLVYTGNASASFTEARCWGAVSLDNEMNTTSKSVVDESGFFYNLTGNPHNGNSAKQICNLENDGQFNGTISGLTEDTKYYYAAFVRIGNDYYYGETKVFKTQKKNNPNPNPDPDPNPEIEPNAITGGHYKETTTTATIECTYENVPSDADCGYFLDEESNSTSVGISMNRSLGYVEGKQVIPLSGLKPGKTYYYQAYIKYDGKSYLGSEQSFKTKELNPIATTGGCSDVTDKSAIVECTFEDVPEGGKCYVLLQWVENGEYKMITYGANEGKNLKISCSGLKPATTYYYTAAISYNGKEYVGEEKSFTTDFPDLSGTWTFNQDWYEDKTISANLVYKSSGDGCVVYKASGFYGVWSMECTFSADRTIYIYCYSPYGYTGSFSGKINDDFTSASGDSYYYGTPSWANPGWTVEKPWSFSR